MNVTSNAVDPAKPAKTPVPPLDLTGAELSIVGPEVLAEHRRPRTGRTPKPRDKSQLVIDKLVKQAYDKWVAAGRPKEFDKSPGAQLRVPTGQVVALEKAIRRAGQFLDLSIRFGNVEEGEETTTVVFKASDRNKK